MTTYRIASIKAKAQRTGWGQDYIDDCRALASTWNEAVGTATYTADALAELRVTWNETQKATNHPANNRQTTTKQTHKPCKNCRGL